jgi:hypothetical protein
MPAVAIKLDPANDAELWLMRRAGYADAQGPDGCWILLGHLEGGPFHYDKYDTGSSTRFTTLEYLAKHFDELEPGAVICTEHIRGERDTPKVSERMDEP